MANSNDSRTACGICCACIGVSGVFGSVLAWFILSCIALGSFNDADVRAACPESNLWAALLTWVIIVGVSLFGGGSAAKNKNDNTDTLVKICGGVFALCVWGGLNAWLGAELFSGCVQANLVDSKLYHLSWIWFITVCCLIGLVLLVVLGFGCAACCTKTDTPLPSHYSDPTAPCQRSAGGTGSYTPPSAQAGSAQTNANTASAVTGAIWPSRPADVATTTRDNTAKNAVVTSASVVAPRAPAGASRGSAPPPMAYPGANSAFRTPEAAN